MSHLGVTKQVISNSSSNYCCNLSNESDLAFRVFSDRRTTFVPGLKVRLPGLRRPSITDDDYSFEDQQYHLTNSTTAICQWSSQENSRRIRGRAARQWEKGSRLILRSGRITGLITRWVGRLPDWLARRLACRLRRVSVLDRFLECAQQRHVRRIEAVLHLI